MTVRDMAEMTEEEYIEQCRQLYRSKTNDIDLVLRKRLREVGDSIYPDNAQASHGIRNAISVFIRARFKLSRITFAHIVKKDEILSFVDDLEKLVKPDKPN